MHLCVVIKVLDNEQGDTKSIKMQVTNEVFDTFKNEEDWRWDANNNCVVNLLTHHTISITESPDYIQKMSYLSALRQIKHLSV